MPGHRRGLGAARDVGFGGLLGCQFHSAARPRMSEVATRTCRCASNTPMTASLSPGCMKEYSLCRRPLTSTRMVVTGGAVGTTYPSINHIDGQDGRWVHTKH